METSSYEDGFNVVEIRCDGCGREVSQPRRDDREWFHVHIEPIARDAWNKGDDLANLDFCSTACFRDAVSDLDPSAVMGTRD